MQTLASFLGSRLRAFSMCSSKPAAVPKKKGPSISYTSTSSGNSRSSVSVCTTSSELLDIRSLSLETLIFVESMIRLKIKSIDSRIPDSRAKVSDENIVKKSVTIKTIHPARGPRNMCKIVRQPLILSDTITNTPPKAAIGIYETKGIRHRKLNNNITA